MKTVTTLAAASIAFGVVAADTAVECQFIVGQGEAPAGTKAYAAGVRLTPDGTNFCGGVLITPTHVLTTAHCTSLQEARFVSVGSHFNSGSEDGEQIEVHHAENHTHYNSSTGSYDFALLTLVKPSNVTPIILPKTDDSDIVQGMQANAMSWDDKTNQFQDVIMELWGNKECEAAFSVDNSSVCAASKGSCIDGMGGALVKDNGQGDVDDVLIGLVNRESSCDASGTPTVFSRVSTAIEWIKSVTGIH
ncbi:hypothetical protein JG687_00016348 [Phytophthora cactorum]|uniref:Peptidase S1 domain-containing protein n=1 Tax=Phytophthora cactorum TaxID=29920 RepID=A0A8T1TRA1_9STRA|nr:hypothetical protein PC120_g11863 [Phytophthora cactorum]KAG3048973.1 hypothetical protein PC121_g19161 [Phytophthora cactorum]KAG4044831.1 hypothetical protein PC123_g19749 [Phytophthora cactorum]KAG6947059.1 hypothetical protein JG687_00016348 [Phytophthora cactorum]